MPKACSIAAKTCSETIGLTPMVPMPCTLEWPRSGSSPAIALADHAAQQREVGDRLDVVDAVQVVGHAHAPGEDDVLPVGVAGGDALDIRPSKCR